MPATRRLRTLRAAAPQSDDEQSKQRGDYRRRPAVALLTKIQRQCRERRAEQLILDIPAWRSRTEFHTTFHADQLDDPTQFHVYNPIADFKQYYGKQLYWEKAHGHFTPLGCRIVGEGLARMALELGLLGHDFRKEER